LQTGLPFLVSIETNRHKQLPNPGPEWTIVPKEAEFIKHPHPSYLMKIFGFHFIACVASADTKCERTVSLIKAVLRRRLPFQAAFNQV
jgi:hypothetical protein